MVPDYYTPYPIIVTGVVCYHTSDLPNGPPRIIWIPPDFIPLFVTDKDAHEPINALRICSA